MKLLLILLISLLSLSGEAPPATLESRLERRISAASDSVHQGAARGATLGDSRTSQYLPLLQEQRVAVYSNASGIVGDRVENALTPPLTPVTDETSLIPFGTPADPSKPVVYGSHIVDFLIENGIDVSLIFSPEHGFRGDSDAGEAVDSGIDSSTGVPICSLYGRKRIPSEEDLSRFDILVVDIQDVGLRFFTYYVTMQRLMDVCAASGKKMIVLDRPNPNGSYVDGPLLDMALKSGVGSIPIPVVHGMTIGELALMINGEGWLNCGRKLELTVVPSLGYDHSMCLNLIKAPSPNLKDMKAVLLYPSTCFFEGMPLSLGRGTDFPFEVYGHPAFRDCTFSFTPRSRAGATSPLFQDRECFGVDLRGISVSRILSEGINLGYVQDGLKRLQDNGVQEEPFGNGKHFDHLSGQMWVREMLLKGVPAAEIKARWARDVQEFRKLRAKYLLYPDAPDEQK